MVDMPLKSINQSFSFSYFLMTRFSSYDYILHHIKNFKTLSKISKCLLIYINISMFIHIILRILYSEDDVCKYQNYNNFNHIFLCINQIIHKNIVKKTSILSKIGLQSSHVVSKSSHQITLSQATKSQFSTWMGD